MDEKGIHIAGKLRVIEGLKTQMLMDVAQLFEELNDSSKSSNLEIGDIMADIVILSYLLAKQLGIPYTQIDRRIINKTKLAIVESGQNDSWHNELVTLLQHFE